MFYLKDTLKPLAVRAGLVVPHKKALFQQLAQIAHIAYGIDQQLVIDRLTERERLGSTGFGNGIALPHGKIDQLEQIIGVCVQLTNPIEFDAIDDMPIDLVFMLLSPKGDGAGHLKALAGISRMMRDRLFVEKLRGAASDDALCVLLESHEPSVAA